MGDANLGREKELEEQLSASTKRADEAEKRAQEAEKRLDAVKSAVPQIVDRRATLLALHARATKADLAKRYLGLRTDKKDAELESESDDMALMREMLVALDKNFDSENTDPAYVRGAFRAYMKHHGSAEPTADAGAEKKPDEMQQTPTQPNGFGADSLFSPRFDGGQTELGAYDKHLQRQRSRGAK